MNRYLRVVCILIFMAAGFGVGVSLSSLPFVWTQNQVLLPILFIAPTLIFGIAGGILAPWLLGKIGFMSGWIESAIQKMSTDDLITGTVGLIIGLIIATLIGVNLARIPYVGFFTAIFCCVFFGIMGMNIALKRRNDIRNILNRARYPQRDRSKTEQETESPLIANVSGGKVLDTSVIIDGRIADICKSGFIEGELIIPSFVLSELQHIADSSDSLKRNRGRRGLDILNTMRKDLKERVRIEEVDFQDLQEVDSKLIRLAQSWQCDILTNDYNLNKVASLQDVQVLNINELANALKPLLIPGEEFGIHIIREGKENKQGIGYLDDGTMIVVESGKRYIDSTILVVVTSALQTAAGRMIFAKPKYNDMRVYVEERPVG